MGTRPDKKLLLEALRQQIQESLKSVTTSQKVMQEGATHEENRQEGSKDMRSTEVSYVARGLAARVEELQDAAAKLVGFSPQSFPPDAAIGLGALVGLLDEDEKEHLYFLVPAGGGEKLSQGGVLVRTLTPTSPLGSEMVGRRVDEEVELPDGRSLLVLWVC